MAQTLSHLTAYVGEGGRENGSNSVSSLSHIGSQMRQSLSHSPSHIGSQTRQTLSHSPSFPLPHRQSDETEFELFSLLPSPT